MPRRRAEAGVVVDDGLGRDVSRRVVAPFVMNREDDHHVEIVVDRALPSIGRRDAMGARLDVEHQGLSTASGSPLLIVN